MPNKNIIRTVVTVILMALVIFANIITIRLMSRYAVEMNFYDKLSVAFDFGGIDALKKELSKIKLQEKMPYALKIVAEFEKKLPALNNPEAFVDDALKKSKQRIFLFRHLRSISFILILLILVIRIYFNLSLKKKEQSN